MKFFIYLCFMFCQSCFKLLILIVRFVVFYLKIDLLLYLWLCFPLSISICNDCCRLPYNWQLIINRMNTFDDDFTCSKMLICTCMVYKNPNTDSFSTTISFLHSKLIKIAKCKRNSIYRVSELITLIIVNKYLYNSQISGSYVTPK